MGKSMKPEKWKQWAITIGLWILVAWLLYPLFTLDSYNINKIDTKDYLFRSTLGILIMIIMLGKNIFDMFMPQAYSQKTPLINTVFLLVYSFILAGVILFMVARLITLYIDSMGSEISF